MRSHCLRGYSISWDIGSSGNFFAKVPFILLKLVPEPDIQYGFHGSFNNCSNFLFFSFFRGICYRVEPIEKQNFAARRLFDSLTTYFFELQTAFSCKHWPMTLLHAATMSCNKVGLRRSSVKPRQYPEAILIKRRSVGGIN